MSVFDSRLESESLIYNRGFEEGYSQRGVTDKEQFVIKDATISDLKARIEELEFGYYYLFTAAKFLANEDNDYIRINNLGEPNCTHSLRQVWFEIDRYQKIMDKSNVILEKAKK